MSSFKDRDRGTKEKCLEILAKPNNAISHLLDNEDGTFSIMYHIVCEHCDYCNEEGKIDIATNPHFAHIAKEDPYEISGRE